MNNEELKTDNDVHPSEMSYSMGGPVDDGAPSLNKKRSHKMKEEIDIAKGVKDAITEDVDVKNVQA